VAVFAIILVAQETFAQSLPVSVKTYLGRNYAGWELSPSKKGCGQETNNGVVRGYFNGDQKRDFAVKFTRSGRGYILAFLASNNGYKPFVLHKTDAQEIEYSSLSVWKKGDRFELGEQNVYVKYDAPADFHCESDVGGIHLYRNGRFIAY